MAFSYKWLGQGGFMFNLGDKKVVIDPYLSDSVIKLDGFKRILPLPLKPEDLESDLLITTHDHMDHLDPDTLVATNYARNTYAGPEDCVRHMKELGIPAESIIRLGAGDVTHVGEARIMGVPAVHTAPEAIGVVIEYHGVKMYVSGDTLYDERLRDIGSLGIDIMFICINGRLGNMNYHEAANLTRELPCRIVVPDHFGMFAENTIDPQLFVDEMRGSGIYVHVPEFNRECDIFELMGRAENG